MLTADPIMTLREAASGGGAARVFRVSRFTGVGLGKRFSTPCEGAIIYLTARTEEMYGKPQNL